ncbi:hypothetical protein BRSU_2051 [Brachyspira suanatina]|uniref:Uncharacterized protein n=1 Tax=Brachyspira suanatina TaxID=381802 RepID=A0A0G4K9K4_9SPIR|nr:hypothetical protein [Brachyspira suanatina]CRF34490.1 hypothetical protein BRSU_2051 [Brachyspira suanatina]
MKKIIILFSFALIIFLQNTKLYSQEEKGMFYFLIGTEGNEKAIMYLQIIRDELNNDDKVEGYYYTSNNESFSFTGEMKGNELYIENLYSANVYDISEESDYSKAGQIKGTLSNDLTFEGNRNSKKIKLSLANTKINKAHIINKSDSFYSGNVYVFDYDILNEAIGEYSYYRFNKIAYIDDSIIIFDIAGIGGMGAGSGFIAFSINDGKEINIGNFLNIKDPNLIDKFPLLDESDYCTFSITPQGKIILVYSPGTIVIESDDFENGWSYNTPGETAEEFTFEELKPFVKKGSPLEYLFN